MEIKSEEYLRSTSALAQKIGQDLDAVREAYQDLWTTLTPNEQQQVLDEAVIDPAAVIKYAKCRRNGSDGSYEFSCDNQFSWFTRSQLDLFTDISFKTPKTPSKKSEIIINTNNNPPQESMIIENKTKESNLLNKPKNKVTNLKIPSTFEEKQSLMEAKPQVSVIKSLAKPKTPPPPPPTKQVLTEKKALLEADESDPDIPKTGFDFLDNW